MSFPTMSTVKQYLQSKKIGFLCLVFAIFFIAYGFFGNLWISYEEKKLSQTFYLEAEILKNQGEISEAVRQMDYGLFHKEIAQNFAQKGLFFLILGLSLSMSGLWLVRRSVKG